MRAARDLLRRRLHLVRKRGQLLAHIQMTSHQYNLPPLGKRIAYPSHREGVADHFEDRVVKKSVVVDLALLECYDDLITDLELYLVRQAKQHDAQAFHLLRTIPGVGKVLALTILYEIHDVKRFDRVQEFASYARLVMLARLEKRHGKGKALSILAHKIGRAAYFMLAREKAFDGQRFAATAMLERRVSERARRLTRAPWIELERDRDVPLRFERTRHRS
jgi:transposase